MKRTTIIFKKSDGKSKLIENEWKFIKSINKILFLCPDCGFVIQAHYGRGGIEINGDMIWVKCSNPDCDFPRDNTNLRYLFENVGDFAEVMKTIADNVHADSISYHRNHGEPATVDCYLKGKLTSYNYMAWQRYHRRECQNIPKKNHWSDES